MPAAPSGHSSPKMLAYCWVAGLGAAQAWRGVAGRAASVAGGCCPAP